VLCALQVLLSLNVSNNQLGDAAIANITDAIADYAYSVTELDISHNRVRPLPVY